MGAVVLRRIDRRGRERESGSGLGSLANPRPTLLSVRLLLTTLLLFVAVNVALNGATGRVWAQDFIRGDFNGDGDTDVGDSAGIFNYILGLGPAATNGCGPDTLLDIGDVNDNEFVTLADPMSLLNSVFGGGPPIAAPNSCGSDPTAGFDGFDVADSDYRVSVYPPVVTSDRGSTTVEYPILITAPSDVIGLELYFAFDPTIISNPILIGNNNLAAQEVVFNVVVVRLADIGNPVNIGVGTTYIGSLVFDLTPGETAPELDFVAEIFSEFQRRATIVTPDFRDHHPIEQTEADPYFLRGDCSGDGLYTQFDLNRWLDYVYTDLPLVVSSCSPFPGDTFDCNDNEFVTTADYLRLADFMSATSTTPLAEPSTTCGQDLTDTTAGFDTVDGDYRIIATNILLIGAGPVERDVRIQLQVVTPTPMAGFQLALQWNDPDLELDAIPFDPTTPLSGPEFSIPREERGRALVTFAQGQGAWLPGMPGVVQNLGTLRFKLNDISLAGSIEFVDGLTLGFVDHYTSIIDTNYNDHRPLTGAGAMPFQRGDANADGSRAITDAIFILNYLFVGGALPPCFDAADANNDAAVGIADALSILNMLFLGAGPLPDPFNCGPDTEIDELGCATYNFCP